MCERKDAREAQNAAADGLALACLRLCEDDIGAALRTAWNEAIGEPIPEVLKSLLGRLK